MAYLKPESDCNCETCEGHYSPPSMMGHPVIGGWICACQCHRDPESKDQRVQERRKRFELEGEKIMREAQNRRKP